MTSNQILVAANIEADRIPALDFTKGTLVLFMVLYHWLNYFVSPAGDIYRYLRFLTPSFIFITGFLISNVYLSRYDLGDRRPPKRLIRRGAKILGLFTVLNVITSVFVSESYRGKILFLSSIGNIFSIYVTGNIGVPGEGKLAIFYILVPISYVLILSAGLLIACRLYKYVFHAVGVLLLLGILLLYVNGFESANLELLTIGLLGMISGYLPIEKINDLTRHPYAIVAAYLCYTVGITVLDVVYPVQVVGVYLTLLLIYMLGVKSREVSRVRSHIILLGKYSLFGYIAQIVVLQLLYRGLRHVDLGIGIFPISFLGAFVLTMMTVEMVERARAKSTTADRLYRVVFA